MAVVETEELQSYFENSAKTVLRISDQYVPVYLISILYRPNTFQGQNTVCATWRECAGAFIPE